MGLEPMTSSLPRKCSTAELRRLLTCSKESLQPFTLVSHRRQKPLSGRRGSNSRPIAWKAIALPTELLPHFQLRITNYQLQTLAFEICNSPIRNWLWLWGGKDSNLRNRSNGFTVRPI